jgi:hypothetical protein
MTAGAILRGCRGRFDIFQYDISVSALHKGTRLCRVAVRFWHHRK